MSDPKCGPPELPQYVREAFDEGARWEAPRSTKYLVLGNVRKVAQLRGGVRIEIDAEKYWEIPHGPLGATMVASLEHDLVVSSGGTVVDTAKDGREP
jgi:hypothetical protein